VGEARDWGTGFPLKAIMLGKMSRLEPEHHHHVYVVLLGRAVARLRKVLAASPNSDSKRPCVSHTWFFVIMVFFRL